jgi:hypothetical protein
LEFKEVESMNNLTRTRLILLTTDNLHPSLSIN